MQRFCGQMPFLSPISRNDSPDCITLRLPNRGRVVPPFMLAFRHTSAGVLYSLSPFWRPFSRWTWVSRCLLKQRMMEVVSGDKWNIGAIIRANLQSNHHHQQTNIQFFTGRMPFLSPNQQCQSTEGENITFHGLAHPKLTGGSSNFVSDH